MCACMYTITIRYKIIKHTLFIYYSNTSNVILVLSAVSCFMCYITTTNLTSVLFPIHLAPPHYIAEIADGHN